MGEHQNHQTDSGSSSKRHALIMTLCCLLPMVSIIAVFLVFPGNPYLYFLVVLICPLSMLLMFLPQLQLKKKKIEK